MLHRGLTNTEGMEWGKIYILSSNEMATAFDLEQWVVEIFTVAGQPDLCPEAGWCCSCGRENGEG